MLTRNLKMHKKTFDKKVAMKLLNQYAERYNRISEENKCIRMQMQDLQSNIVINKEIIETFLSSSPSDIKENKLITQYNKEVKNLHESLKHLSTEKEKMLKKVKYYEDIINKSITEYRESTDCLKDRIFVLENVIIKKDNMITSLNNQIIKMKEEEDKKNIEFNNTFSDEDNDETKNKEKNEKVTNDIYVIDPTVSVNLIQEDLSLYKQAYENALAKIKETNMTIKRNEKKIDELSNELFHYQNKNNSPSYHNTDHHNESIIEDGNDIRLEELLSLTTITKDELDIVSQTNIGMKVLLVLDKALCEKEKKIKQYENDINDLIQKSRKLTNENMILYKSVLDYKKNYELFKNNTNRDYYICANIGDNYVNTNASMVGNVSRDGIRKKSKKGIIKMLSNSNMLSETVNQSAQDATVELTTNEDMIKKNNNLTEISEDYFDYNGYHNMINDDKINKTLMKKSNII